MKLLPTISFRVTTEREEVLDEQCSQCAYFHAAHEPCVLPKQQRPRNRLTKQRPSSSAPTPVQHTAIAPSQPPSYPEKRSRKPDPTPPRSINEPPVPAIPSRFARSVLAPIAVPSSGEIGAPRLRRRDSPTETSLRDLSSMQCQQQQTRLRAQRSEIRLQRVYESQLESYLNGGFVALDSVQE